MSRGVENPLCPCLDNLHEYGLEGDLIANIVGKAYNYGPTYGLRACEAHDTGTQPYCHDGVAGGPPAWCQESWCYVDPTRCHANITIEASAYFSHAGVFFTTEACGSGPDDFLNWYLANASTIGLPCATDLECFGDQVTCSGRLRTCGCRAVYAVEGEDCTQLTWRSLWPLCSLCTCLIAYLICLFRLCLIYRYTQRSPRSPALTWALTGVVCMLVDISYRLLTMANLTDKLSYSIVTNIAETLGAAAAITGYCTVAIGWLSIISATKGLGRLDAKRLRRSRTILYMFTLIFVALVLVLVLLMIMVDTDIYTIFVGVFVVVAILIAIAFGYARRELQRLVASAGIAEDIMDDLSGGNIGSASATVRMPSVATISSAASPVSSRCGHAITSSGVVGPSLGASNSGPSASLGQTVRWLDDDGIVLALAVTPSPSPSLTPASSADDACVTVAIDSLAADCAAGPSAAADAEGFRDGQHDSQHGVPTASRISALETQTGSCVLRRHTDTTTCTTCARGATRSTMRRSVGSTIVSEGLPLIAHTALWLALSLAGFVVCGICWHVAHNVLGSLILDWLSVTGVHLSVGGGLAILGRYVHHYHLLTTPPSLRDMHRASSYGSSAAALSAGGSNASLGSKALAMRATSGTFSPGLPEALHEPDVQMSDLRSERIDGKVCGVGEGAGEAEDEAGAEGDTRGKATRQRFMASEPKRATSAPLLRSSPLASGHAPSRLLRSNCEERRSLTGKGPDADRN